MHSDFLSDIELYYSSSVDPEEEQISITGDEAKHISLVMRHSRGDTLYITNGKGKIFETSIIEINKSSVNCAIKSFREQENIFNSYYFCLPRLKSTDRFEFALEKCVELGITRFIVYNSARGISKGEKLERWNKILLAAMKQSLRSHLPMINTADSLQSIISRDGEKVFLEQKSLIPFSEFIPLKSTNYFFIFGPEGGFDDKETGLSKNYPVYKLNNARLRSETAIISAASGLSL